MLLYKPYICVANCQDYGAYCNATLGKLNAACNASFGLYLNKMEHTFEKYSELPKTR